MLRFVQTDGKRRACQACVKLTVPCCWTFPQRKHWHVMQKHKGAACTTRKHQVCEEHAEHRLQAAQRELYDAQARIQRYGRETVRFNRYRSRSSSLHQALPYLNCTHLHPHCLVTHPSPHLVINNIALPSYGNGSVCCALEQVSCTVSPLLVAAQVMHTTRGPDQITLS